MTRTFATRAAPIALAALLTSAMLLATNALAGHQFHVAATAQQPTQLLALETQRVVVIGHRTRA